MIPLSWSLQWSPPSTRPGASAASPAPPATPNSPSSTSMLPSALGLLCVFSGHLVCVCCVCIYSLCLGLLTHPGVSVNNPQSSPNNPLSTFSSSFNFFLLRLPFLASFLPPSLPTLPLWLRCPVAGGASRDKFVEVDLRPVCRRCYERMPDELKRRLARRERGAKEGRKKPAVCV